VESLFALLKDKLAEGGDALLGSYELEARFGYINPMDNTFTPGVSQDVFDKVLTSMTLYDGWDSATHFVESRDVFYATEDGHQVRTTTLGDSVMHTRKEKIKTVSLCATGQRVNVSGTPLDIRVALAKESLVLLRDIPPQVLPDSIQMVRIKQRKSFFWGAWRWDLTRVWNGSTFLEADRALATVPPILEVELELAKPEQYLTRDRNSIKHAASSILLKLHDLVAPACGDPSLQYFPPEHFKEALGTAACNMT